MATYFKGPKDFVGQSLNEKWTNVSKNKIFKDAIKSLSVGIEGGSKLYVDSQYGDNSSAVLDNPSLPFSTLAAAEAVASAGDTIVIRNGTYTEKNIGKDGITYELSSGTKLMPIVGQKLFVDTAGSISYRVVGDGVLAAFNSLGLVELLNDSNVLIDVSEILYEGTTDTGAMNIKGNSVLVLRANKVVNNGRNATLNVDGDNVNNPLAVIDVKYIFSRAASFLVCIDGASSVLEFDYAEHDATSSTGAFMYNAGGKIYADGNLLIVKQTSATGVGVVEKDIWSTGNTHYGRSYFNFDIEYSSTLKNPIELNPGGKVYYTGRYTYKNVASSLPLFDLAAGSVDANSQVFLRNATLVNENELAGSHVIRTRMTSIATQPNVIAYDSEIIVNSIALSLGAKAVAQTGGALRYTRNGLITNGLIDGTDITLTTLGVPEYNNGNSGTALQVNLLNSNSHLITLNGNATLTFTGVQRGFTYTLRLKQDGVGSRTVTWPANVRWEGGSVPILTTAPNSTDIVTLYYDGTLFYGSAKLNYS